MNIIPLMKKAEYQAPQESFFVTAAGVVWSFPLGDGVYLTKELRSDQFEQLISDYGKKLYEKQEQERREIEQMETRQMPVVEVEKK